jgi:hypothetical protein
MAHSIAVRLAAALAMATATLSPAFAGSAAAEAVGTCMADNTTGKDRKDLTRWVFIAMAAHPDIRDLGQVSSGAADESSRKIAALLTRLMTESCVNEIRQLVQSEGPESLRTAFEFLGKVAFQELTTNQDVGKSLQGFTQYMDRSKVERVFANR